MTVHGKINGQSAREAAEDLRCVLRRAPIGLNDFARRNVVWDQDEAEDEWFVAHELCARFVLLSDE